MITGYDLNLEPLTPELLKKMAMSSLRKSRDKRLAETDYLIMPDYPLPEDKRIAVLVYRQALRDLPEQEGAPWDGGGIETPWPDMPVINSK